MPKDTTAIETSNADKVFDLPVKLDPGHVNTMSFPQDSISEMHLTSAKELVISFQDGSKVQIENFQELVNSAQSCGKDTIIQLSDNTIIYPEELNAQLAQGPVSFGEKNAQGNDVFTLNEPPAGQIVEKNIEAGHEYKLGFNTDATASAAQAGQNLILTFKDGGVLVLKNYYTAMNAELPPAMTLADGSVIDSNALLTSCKFVDTPSFAQSVAEETAAATASRKASVEAVPNVEPAAGDEVADASGARAGRAAKKGEGAPDVEPAAGNEAVADIEPAAGEAGGLSGGRGGRSFASEPSGIALNGLGPVGAIGATQLAYDAPDARLGPVGQTPAQAAVVTPDSNPFGAASVASLDESSAHTVSGAVLFDFGNDGPSQTVPPVQATGDFAFAGSATGGKLTSNGADVVVTRVGDTYTGTANGATVFTFVIKSDGTYTFTQFKALDHADGADANDVINLDFGVVGTDKDGDQAITSVTINVIDDAPVANDDGATTGQTVSGNVLTNDVVGYDASAKVISVTINGTTVAVPATGTVTIDGTYGKLVIGANGAYTYTSNNTALGTDEFSYTMKDYDGDTASAKLSVTINDLDTNPVVGSDIKTVDETSFGTTLTATGKVPSNFFGDAPGTITANNSFTSGGSKTGGNLTSNGVAVAVTLSGNTYTGKAGAETVFTLVVNSDGSYTYTQFKTLDHADKTNPDDVINLNFGVIGTDADGDKASGSITINVKDDGPTAVVDTATVNPTTHTVAGNVTTNDSFGADGKPTHAVTKVIFNGTTFNLPTDGSNITITSANGTLTINDKGAYSYTATTTTGGVDKFTYVIADKDGDTDTAPATSTLTITTDDVDYTPTVTSDTKTIDETTLGPITVTGNVTANYFTDGPGNVSTTGGFSSGGSKLGGNLTSNGVAVVVTQVGNVYTGKAGTETVFTLTVNANGSYSFVLNKPLDHADKTNPDDIINLNFGIQATDADGDKANGTITINVKDDGPVAVADSATVNPATNTISGNVTSNDNFGQDGKPTHAVTKVIFNGTTYTLPTDGTNITITSANGKLVINDKGAYTYTATTTTGGTDKFTYVIADKDGDTDTAPATSTLTITTDDVDYTPTVTSDTKTIDETTLGPITVTGAVNANYFADGPGAISANGSFTSGGSKTAGNLTSNGVAVIVTQVGNVYTGKAGTETVFTMTINANGSYSFVLNKPLDHADKTNPNDSIALNFGVISTDADGDKSTPGKITINVLDDAPVANDDTNSYDVITGVGQVVTGNVVTGVNGGTGAADKLSVDTGNSVTKVSFNGISYDVPTTGTVSVQGTYGTLKLAADGSYTYTITNIGGVLPGLFGVTITDAFVYTLTDKDGDSDPAILTLSGCGCNDDVPTIGNDTKIVDETNLGPITVTGKVATYYGVDGAGPVTATGSFSYGGSKLFGNLTSNGVAVTVTQVNNVYTGKAGTETVFTLTVNTDGTYSFVLNKPLDHADKTNPDDVINLNFGVITKDADGDLSNKGTITINVKDDGPVAVADSASVSQGSTTITGNVTGNDNFGQDGKPVHAVTKVIFNGTTFALPVDGSNVTITSANGKLTINHTGQYSYTATTTTGGTDKFTYVIADKDGDTDTAPATSTLTITTDDVDYTPTVTSDTKTIDETNLSPTISINGTVAGNYQGDGPGTVTGNSSFTSGGSKLGGNLTSDGVAVVVTQSGNVYTGKAGAVTVFTLTINTDGSYNFVLNKPLDHADGANPNDSIALNFGVIATDADGDKSTPGKITINVLDDAPIANDDINAYVGGQIGTVLNGNVVSGLNGGNGAADKLSKDVVNVVSKVSFNGTSYDVPATGTVSVQGNHGLLKLAADGTYTYTITFVGTNPTITDSFIYTLKDDDGDTDPAILTLSGADCIIDATPVIGNDTKTIDETNLGPITTIGTVVADYKTDGPGTVTTTGGFSSGGSKLGGNLTSNGVAVIVTQVGNVYTGKAGTETVFTLTVNTNGSYSFVLNKPLDHADKTNPDDIINLNFGVVATDKDGDKSNNGTITINVKDDGPTAVADTATVTPGATTVTGNVTTNDNFGQDGKPVHSVTKVIFNGTTFALPVDGSNITITSANGKLTINHTGQYSYTATTTTGGTDKFTYVIADKDGDTDTAPATSTLTITTDDIDYIPTVTSDTKTIDETNLGPITVTGTVAANYFGDVAGSITGNGSFSSGGSKTGGNLTSNGVPVVVTQSGNVYTGTANGVTVFTMTIQTNGSYTFVLNKPLDHADKSNPNDSISLDFGVIATDGDGDKSTPGKITINVLDDGPVAVADTANVPQGSNTVTGNVTGNDNFGQDGKPVHAVTKVTFGGTTFTLPTDGTNVTITTPNGKLVINHTGAYTYTSTTTTGGKDTFSYVIADKDGDTDTAPATSTLTVTVDDIDYTPTVTNDTKTVDETSLNPTTTVSGTVVADFKGDGPGTVTGNNTFTTGGSLFGGKLTSCGVPVVVTQVGNVYTGKAGTETVFTLTLLASGAYTFVLNKNLDHGNPNNPNDSLSLNFGVTATDADGDKANSTITINVLDDGPSISGSAAIVDESNMKPTTAATGKVTADFGADHDGTITGNNTFSSSGSLLNGQLTSKGVAVTVSQVGNTYIGKAGAEEVFKLTINDDGTYNYLQSKVLDHADPKDPNDIIKLDFGVTATDCDGDKANANIVISVLDDGPIAVPTPSVVVCANNYNDLYLNGTGWAANVYMTADGIGQGQQVVTVTLTGIPQGWSFYSYQGGAYNASAGTWTKTLAPGEDFDGKFYFKAPNETDVLNVNWTATVSEGGHTASSSDSFNIIVGAEDHPAMTLMSMMASDDVLLVDTTHTSTTETSALSKVATADDSARFLSLSSVIEQDNTDTQSAIDSFVHQTTAKTASVETPTVAAETSVAAHAQAVEVSPAEQIHHLQSQVA